jgi:hypothetical protein
MYGSGSGNPFVIYHFYLVSALHTTRNNPIMITDNIIYPILKARYGWVDINIAVMFISLLRSQTNSTIAVAIISPRHVQAHISLVAIITIPRYFFLIVF